MSSIRRSVAFLCGLSLACASCGRTVPPAPVPEISASSSSTNVHQKLSGGTAHYRNDVYGFSFDYPLEWKVRGEPAETNIAVLEEIPQGSGPNVFPDGASVGVYVGTTVDRLVQGQQYERVGESHALGRNTVRDAVLGFDGSTVFLLEHAGNVLALSSHAFDEDGLRAADAVLQSLQVFDPPAMDDVGKDFTAVPDIPFTFSTRGLPVTIAKSATGAAAFVRARADYLLGGCNASAGAALSSALPKLAHATVQDVTIAYDHDPRGSSLEIFLLPNVFGYADVHAALGEWQLCDVGGEIPVMVNSRWVILVQGCGGADEACGMIDAVVRPTLRWKP